MLDVLLVYPQTTLSAENPEIEDDPGRSLPLGLCSIAAAAEASGYRVGILDARLHTSSAAENALKAYLADGVRWLGFSVMTCQVPHALHLSRIGRALSKDVSILWGGAHPTLFPEQTVQSPAVDWVAIGEGEEALTSLLAGTPTTHAELTGLATVDGEDVVRGPRAPALDPSRFPLPAYHLLDLSAYLARRLPNGDRVRGIDVLTSRGCPYRCAFCPNTFLLGRRWRPLPAEGVGELMQLVTRLAKPESVWFVDDYFFGDIARAEGIARQVRTNHAGVGWEANIRPDLFRPGKIDDACMRELRASGCHTLRMGAESGSERVLEILRKDITVEDIRHGVQACEAAGIVPVCFFMMGVPGETTQDLMDTVALMAELACRHPTVVPCGPGVFRPYPGGDLYGTCVESGLREPSSLEEWAEYPFSQGYLDPHDLPWVADASLVSDLPFYLFYVQERRRLETYSLPRIRRGMAQLSTWRARTRRWGWRWEVRVARGLRWARGHAVT